MNFTHLNFGTCSSQCDQCTHLDIYDGDSKSSPSLGRFCPGSAEEVKVSSGNQMFVEFESGFNNDRGTGFEVQYSETTDDTNKTEPPTSNYHFYLIFMLCLHGPNKTTEAYKSTVIHYISIYRFPKTLHMKYILNVYIFCFLITKVHVYFLSKEQYLLFLIWELLCILALSYTSLCMVFSISMTGNSSILNICLLLRSSITRINFQVCSAMSKEKL